MIADAVLNLVFAVIDAVTGLLPTFSAPFTYAGSTVQDAITQVVGKLNYLNGWVDTSLLVTVLTALAVAYGVAGTVYGVLWVYRHMPGKGT